MNKIMIILIFAFIFVILFGFLYFSIPSYKPTPISTALQNPETYKTKKVMIEGTPVLLSIVKTRYGSYSFYALKDATGQMPVNENKFGGTSQNPKIHEYLLRLQRKMIAPSNSMINLYSQTKVIIQ